MIKVTVILGQEAVEQYHETNEIPSDKWLKGHSGEVNAIEFRTQGECDAYTQALSDGQGWEESLVVKSEETPRDCPFCQKWHDFFADKKTPVYCPDCGQQILVAWTADDQKKKIYSNSDEAKCEKVAENADCANERPPLFCTACHKEIIGGFYNTPDGAFCYECWKKKLKGLKTKHWLTPFGSLPQSAG